MPISIFGRLSQTASLKKVLSASNMIGFVVKANTDTVSGTAVAHAIHTNDAVLTSSWSLISRLFIVACPSAVVRPVVTIGINAINAVRGGWPFAHVGKEHAEIVPLFANPDTPATVVFEPSGARIVAPLTHIVPAEVCGIANQPMLCDGFGAPINKPTPAAFSVPVIKICSRHLGDVPALTDAVPAPELSPIDVTEVSDSKLAELLSGKVFEILRSSHVATLFSRVVRGLDIGVSSSRYYTMPGVV